MVLPYIVDKEVLLFSEWVTELENEDVDEVGSVVTRTFEQKLQLYGMYLDFQLSDEAVKQRGEQ